MQIVGTSLIKLRGEAASRSSGFAISAQQSCMQGSSIAGLQCPTVALASSRQAVLCVLGTQLEHATLSKLFTLA